MELVLLLHISQYDEQLSRFRSTCFENSGDGTGVSTFVQECAEAASGSVCRHARAFYGRVAGEPPIFWRFDSAILPDGHSLDTQPSDTGDDCHRNIEGLSNNRAKKFFKKRMNPGAAPAIEICHGDEARAATAADLAGQLAQFRASLHP